MKERRTFRLMIFLGLLAALASTPLRLVEAASDQSRTAEEQRDGDPVIEPIDGGVGDDSDATIKADLPDHSFDQGVADRAFEPGQVDLALASKPATDARFERPPRLVEGCPLRLAKLQTYLI